VGAHVASAAMINGPLTFFAGVLTASLVDHLWLRPGQLW